MGQLPIVGEQVVVAIENAARAGLPIPKHRGGQFIQDHGSGLNHCSRCRNRAGSRPARAGIVGAVVRSHRIHRAGHGGAPGVGVGSFRRNRVSKGWENRKGVVARIHRGGGHAGKRFRRRAHGAEAGREARVGRGIPQQCAAPRRRGGVAPASARHVAAFRRRIPAPLPDIPGHIVKTQSIPGKIGGGVGSRPAVLVAGMVSARRAGIVRRSHAEIVGVGVGDGIAPRETPVLRPAPRHVLPLLDQRQAVAVRIEPNRSRITRPVHRPADFVARRKALFFAAGIAPFYAVMPTDRHHGMVVRLGIP